MSTEKLVSDAIDCGTSIGQSSLAEFILRQYDGEISPRMRLFLEKINQSSYENIGKQLHKPSEDVALEVDKAISLGMK